MTPLTSIKQLNYLVALSEQLNFTRAAESCFVTQSTLSAGLKELEDVLGVQLVESGLGIGLVPEMAVRSGLTASPNLVVRPMAKPVPKRTIALATRRSTSRLKDMKALAELFQPLKASGMGVTQG